MTLIATADMVQEGSQLGWRLRRLTCTRDEPQWRGNLHEQLSQPSRASKARHKGESHQGGHATDGRYLSLCKPAGL